MIEYILLCLIILFKEPSDKGRGFQHIGRDKSIFQNLLHLFHLFCYLFIHTCAHTCLSQITLILLILRRTIIINGIILSCILRVKNISGNQPSNPLNHLGMFACNHMEYFYLGNFVKGIKKERETKQLTCIWRLTTRSLFGKMINNKH